MAVDRRGLCELAGLGALGLAGVYSARFNAMNYIIQEG